MDALEVVGATPGRTPERPVGATNDAVAEHQWQDSDADEDYSDGGDEKRMLVVKGGRR